MSDQQLTHIGPRTGGRGLAGLVLVLALGIGLIAGLAIVSRPGRAPAPIARVAVALDVPATGAAIPGTGQLVVSGHVNGPIDLLRLTLQARGNVLGSGAVRPGPDGTFIGSLAFRPPLTAVHGEVAVTADGAPAAVRAAVRLLPPAAVYILSPVPNQQLVTDSTLVEGLARADLDRVVVE
ncbi:MAG TPA: hypothetical protein VFW86_07035, partial [Candidatus Limnocylindrales bacterium]|nr:hypothetical protein [Candidatus Limnocylindrales bacterium]